jgi:hypothetical protein
MKRNEVFATGLICLWMGLGAGKALGQYPAAFGQPTYSPYLNLIRSGQPLTSSYYGLVRPQLQTQQGFQHLQRQAAAQQAAVEGTDVGLVTGHLVGFMNHQQYFKSVAHHPTAFSRTDILTSMYQVPPYASGYRLTPVTTAPVAPR